MLLPSINNDQNIRRVGPKMNEDFQYEANNSKIIDPVTYANHKGQLNVANLHFPVQQQPQEIEKEILSNGTAEFRQVEVDSSSDICQTTTEESEVKSLKEWLVLHNDLIQQQNDEILEKERQIYLLRRENEMLKERLLCLEQGVPYRPDKRDFPRPDRSDRILADTLDDNMTQDSCGQYEEDSKENIDLLADPEQDLPQDDNLVTCSLEVSKFQTRGHQSIDVESQVDTTIDEDRESVGAEEGEFKSGDYLANLSDSFKTESDPAECAKDSLSEYNFTVNNFSECNPMKNIKMSIRRKRISSSSMLSSNEPLVSGEKKPTRRIKKKRRRLGKDCQILSSKDPYHITHTNEELPPEPDVTELTGNTLEVPRWRVKHYTSCYTMEGTENLDDEVYNKRHMRLEIDERRRKRWDVQRIREQRVIEKLKQRQERIASGSKCDPDQDSLGSLWPKADDIKYLEIVDELPVSAFGHPIPKFEPSIFSLPWLDNPQILTKRSNGAKRLNSRNRTRSRNRR